MPFLNKLKIKRRREEIKPPFEEVESLLEEGEGESKVFERFRKKGYAPERIQESLNTAKLKLGVSGKLRKHKIREEPKPPFSKDLFEKAEEGGIPEEFEVEEAEKEVSESEEIPKSIEKEELDKILKDVDDIRTTLKDLKNKVDRKEEEVETIKRDLEKAIDHIDSLKKRYLEISQVIEEIKTYKEEIEEVRALVNDIESIMKVALPSIIKNLKDLRKEVSGELAGS